MKSILKLLLILIVFSFSANFIVIAQEKAKDVEIVKIETAYGEILIWLYDATPLHKTNFLKLAKEGYFNSTTFHRAIKNFVVQGGDPNSKDFDTLNDGQGGPDYTIPAEIKPGLTHVYGAIGAAREGDNINPNKESSGSQFYIVINKNGTPHLNGGYTVFGIVIAGMDVAEKIADQPKNKVSSRPYKDIPMTVTVETISVKKLLKKYKFVVPK